MINPIRRAIRAHLCDQHLRSLSFMQRASLPVVAPFAAASLATLLAVPVAVAQPSEEGVTRLEEVIVSARRKDEMLQDVPLTVNVVDDSAISDLNIRQLSDLQSVVPGLTLENNPIGPNASMRGVRFDTFASGFNSTVEFYLNDSPIVSSLAMQGLFDVAQIEVLRGPQGTLRGRASPSGAINITTQQPDLESMGGYVDLTATDHDGYNARAAVNIPLIHDRLGVRLAGFQEENEGARISSITTGQESEYRTEGFRGTMLFTPIDTLSFNLMFQRVEPEINSFTQMESAYLADPSRPRAGQEVRAEDRHTGSNIYNASKSVQERTGLEVAWDVSDFAVINYAGALSTQRLDRKESDDFGDVFNSAYNSRPALQELGQVLRGEPDTEAHELRLTMEFDRFDVVVGSLYQVTDSNNYLEQQTPIFVFTLSPGTFATVNKTPITSSGHAVEKSVFGNVTYHLTDDTELSAGLRGIKYTNESATTVSGRTVASADNEWNDFVYMLSLKHNLTPDAMVYGTLGSSWRPGINAVGDFNTQPSALEKSFTQLDPETSESLELGFKSAYLDNRLRFNVATFYQKFNNYPYRSGTPIYYVSTNASGVESVETFNFLAAAPVEVFGLESELSYQIMESWNAGLMYSWSRGQLDDATIPCNIYSGVPTVADIRNATGGDNVASCQSSARANFAPLWTTTLQSEYYLPLNFGAEAFVRGMWTLYGPSQNDPTNALDDVSSYDIFNLYTGLRSDERTWEVMAYVKNLFDTERVLSRGADPESVSYQAITSFGPPPVTQGRRAVSNYREVTMTAPREIGINVRYNF